MIIQNNQYDLYKKLLKISILFETLAITATRLLPIADSTQKGNSKSYTYFRREFSEGVKKIQIENFILKINE